MAMPNRSGRFVAALLVASLNAIAGCGGSSGGNGTSAPSQSQAALVPWPLFGRVPERTHYLPAKERFLDPPLKEAWSINTHALIEFPPAIADGSPTWSTSTATPRRCG
jgi:hypothetical protein